MAHLWRYVQLETKTFSPASKCRDSAEAASRLGRLDRLRVVEELGGVELFLQLLQARKTLPEVDILRLSLIHARVRIVDVHAPIRRTQAVGEGLDPVFEKRKAVGRVGSPHH